VLRFPDSLNTPRLVLRSLSGDDALAVKDAIDTSLTHLRRWMPWAKDEPTSLAKMRFRLDLHRAEFECGHQWYYGIFPPDGSRLYGQAGIHPLLGSGGLEISYWLRRTETRKGYATEAAGELTRLALRRTSVPFVQIRCDPTNERSIAVANRLGFRRVIPVGDKEAGGAGGVERSMILQLEPPSRPSRPARLP
jgi:RimJ/RimL family protein N-acetyltransferase